MTDAEHEGLPDCGTVTRLGHGELLSGDGGARRAPCIERRAQLLWRGARLHVVPLRLRPSYLRSQEETPVTRIAPEKSLQTGICVTETISTDAPL